MTLSEDENETESLWLISREEDDDIPRFPPSHVHNIVLHDAMR